MTQTLEAHREFKPSGEYAGAQQMNKVDQVLEQAR
jgi:hypothetical protein